MPEELMISYGYLPLSGEWLRAKQKRTLDVAEKVRRMTKLPMYEQDLPRSSHDRLIYTRGFCKAVELIMDRGVDATGAEELFEDLGFVKGEGNEDFEECTYIGDNTKVTFCKDRYIEYRYPTEYQPDDDLHPQEVSFSCDDVVAMYKKCEELGWIR